MKGIMFTVIFFMGISGIWGGPIPNKVMPQLVLILPH
jgi:hypothetical protein